MGDAESRRRIRTATLATRVTVPVWRHIVMQGNRILNRSILFSLFFVTYLQARTLTLVFLNAQKCPSCANNSDERCAVSFRHIRFRFQSTCTWKWYLWKWPIENKVPESGDGRHGWEGAAGGFILAIEAGNTFVWVSLLLPLGCVSTFPANQRNASEC